jgi:two-component system response regulator YesN
MKKVVFRSLLHRYIISYAVVMAILFIGVGIYVNNSYTSAIHDSIVEENTNRLSALRIQHEEKLTALINIANQISLSPYVAPFMLEGNAMRAYNLKEYLASYNADSFFDQLYVTFYEDEYLYSSGTSVSLKTYAEKLMHYDNIPSDSLRSILQSKREDIYILPNKSVQSVLISDANKKITTIIIPLRMDGRFTVGNAIFLVRDSSYERMLIDEINRMRNMYIFYGHEVLAATRPIDIPDDVIRNEISGIEGTIVRNIKTEDGEKYLLFAQDGSNLDMHYVSLIPHETVELQTARSRLTFALFMLLLCIPCSLLVVYFSRMHVRPIKELQKSIGDDTNSDDGFTSIRRGIETLKGQNLALHSRLDESKAACQADFIKKFVKGRISPREKAVREAEKLGMRINCDFYCVLLMSLISPEDEWLDDLFALPENEENANGYGMEIVDQEQYLYLLFGNTKEALELWVNNAKTILSSIDSEAVIAVSNIHVDFSEATAAYFEAGTAYDNRFVMGNERVLWFSDVSSAAKDIEPFSQNYIDGFRKALYAGDARALNDRINELLQILTDKKFSLFAFRIIYNDIIGLLLNKYLSYGDVSKDTIQYYDIFELSKCRKVSDLIDILRQLCNDILSKEERNTDKDDPVIGEIIEYIRKNYSDPDLSMGTIADMYNMSAANLSLTYKEHTGMYPSEYLLLRRMEKAKELLTETELSIQDIGASVGYHDSSSFIRRFKKHMGITPAKYRNAMKQEKTSSS